MNKVGGQATQQSSPIQHGLMSGQTRETERIEYLFRACARESRVHPLKDLLIRYVARAKK
ncbi:MAG TPA: hypothetical protein VFW93_01430 [Aquabacterium sp.]|uniref:hypothetical protein n=1 Tax=Aquabacterium sp. TaxID=1872578 RepID=UPI002E34D1E6|nr:hypothetical protein [Aquabacterium sp.]HEX5354849.1 hypothetical protein [Aquabacterium sp.]